MVNEMTYIALNFITLIVIIILFIQVRLLKRKLKKIKESVEYSRMEISEIKKKLSVIDNSDMPITGDELKDMSSKFSSSGRDL